MTNRFAFEAEALIPQKKPFVFVTRIDEFSSFGGNLGGKVSFDIPPEGSLMRKGRLQAAGLLEHAAQSAAMLNGYEMKEQGCSPQTGFVAAFSRVFVDTLPAAGDRITTEIRQEGDALGALLLSAQTLLSGKEIFRCSMKVFTEVLKSADSSA